MEYGLRLLENNNLPSDLAAHFEILRQSSMPPGNLTSLYFGTEFCEYLLPTVADAEAFCILARDAAVEAVLLTPIVTPTGFKRLERLLAELALRGCTPVVTFNDFGVLRLLRDAYPDNQRYAGRLLNRSLRDPRLAGDPPNSSRQGENKGEKLRSLLVSQGVTAVETDADLEGCYLERDASHLLRVLHLPYTFTVSGRNCLVKADGAAAEDSFTKGLGHGCTAPCRERSLPVHRTDTDLPLWRAGNTIFYEASAATVATHLACCDRIVLHERPLA
jgi:hypothetical protein